MPILLKKEIISATKTLHVFNLEHDLALAVGRGPYTPPAEVMRLRKEKSLLPAIYAEKGDFILVRDSIPKSELQLLPFYSMVEQKNIHPVYFNQLVDISGEVSKVLPWGWDYAIHQSMIENGLSENLLPSKDTIDKIRILSHRRNTIPFRETIAEILGEEIIYPAKEFRTVPEIENYLKQFPVSYFKAPWSSSGRGIVVSDHISRKGLLEWCHGIIRRQGSVIAEPAWDRILDFATEWIIEKGTPVFLGYSVFETSSRGKYHGNISADNSILLNIITSKIPSFHSGIIKAQHSAIEKLISPYYEGYLGIDMLADSLGRINPCVELNLRLTMGHVSLLKNQN